MARAKIDNDRSAYDAYQRLRDAGKRALPGMGEQTARTQLADAARHPSFLKASLVSFLAAAVVFGCLWLYHQSSPRSAGAPSTVVAQQK